MKNTAKNLKLTRKVAEILMNIGDIHANELSIGPGMYEPKISIKILNNSNKDKK